MKVIQENLRNQISRRDYLTQKIFHFWDDRMLLGGVLSFCLFAYISIDTYLEHIRSPSDLAEISDSLYSYSVYKAGKGVHHGVLLSHSIHNFVIAIDMMDSFQEAEFMRNVKYGDPIVLTVPKTVINSIKPMNNVWIFGIKDKNIVYLNPITSLSGYKTSRTFIILWIFFISSALFFGRLAYLYSTAPNTTRSS